MGIETAIIGSALIGGAISSRSAGKAADAQKDAANTASNTQLEAQKLASQTQLDIFERQAALQEPWRQAGMGSLSQLTAGTGAGGEFNQDFATPAPVRSAFATEAPVSRDFTMADFNADPGYAFRMQEGQRALESSAAARGGLLSGGTGKALSDYGQQAGSQEYGAAYDRFNNFENRKRQDYGDAYNRFNTNQDRQVQDYGDAYNRFNADRDRRFNRLADIAGIGQTATRDVSQAAGNTGTNVAKGQIITGNQIADNQMAVGNANSANYIAQGNVANRAIGTIGNWYQQRPPPATSFTDTSAFRWDDPYRNPNYVGGSMGE